MNKDVFSKRLENLNGELDVYITDHTKLSRVLKDLENKVLFTRGKISEVTELLNAFEVNIEEPIPADIEQVETESE